jgi:hypothetical protein
MSDRGYAAPCRATFNALPYTRVRAAVAELYAIILRFLIRARDWYEEVRVAHSIHSITRPVELRHLDFIEQISNSSHIIRAIVTSDQLAEFRGWHKTSSSAFHNIERKMDERFKENNPIVSVIRDTFTRKSDLPKQPSHPFASLAPPYSTWR